jgi:hypothetical protein
VPCLVPRKRFCFKRIDHLFIEITPIDNFRTDRNLAAHPKDTSMTTPVFSDKALDDLIIVREIAIEVHAVIQNPDHAHPIFQDFVKNEVAAPSAEMAAVKS